MNQVCARLFDFHEWRRYFASDIDNKSIAFMIKAAMGKDGDDICKSCSLGIPPVRSGGHHKRMPQRRHCSAVVKPGLQPRKRCNLYRKINKIRLWREALGIRRSELASKMGISMSTLLYMELDYRKSNLTSTVKRYADALGIPIEDIV